MTAILEISNFGAIKSAKIEIKHITILIGEQAAGKSTIAKLIAVFNDTELFLTDKTTKKTFSEILEKYNLQNYLHEQTHIKYTTHTYEREFSNKKLHFATKQSNKQLDVIKPIYIPTERFLISILNNSAIEFMNNSLTLPKMVTQFGTYFQKAKSELKSEIALEFLNIVYTNKNGLDTIKTPTKELYLQEAASGYQSIIPLYLVMKYFAEQSGEKTIIIEEPELNLYPKTQNELVRVLTSLANKNNNNLVVTTHSPYILTSLNNLLFANQIFEKDSLKTKDISKILPKESWIVANNFSAYHIEKGKSKSIFDRKTQLIVETQLDSASEVINTDFDCLMNIYKNL